MGLLALLYNVETKRPLIVRLVSLLSFLKWRRNICDYACFYALLLYSVVRVT